MKSVLAITLCATASLAAPASWSPEMAAVYTETSRAITRSLLKGIQAPPSCDLSKVNITQYLATIPDAPPVKDPGSAKLVQVTLGRGVQNYTCADSQASTVPKAMGAIADLYDVSCVAANYQDLLTLMPAAAVQYDASTEQDRKLLWANLIRTGHHYFNGAGAPTFDLNDSPTQKLGVLVADGKNPEMKVNAPSTAIKGQRLGPNGQTGAVPWLKLKNGNGTGTTNDLTTVYRVDTAGGMAPATCEGQPALISVQYATQYWFYTSS